METLQEQLHEQFRRRPLFWCGLAAVGAVGASWTWGVPLLTWAALFAAGLLLIQRTRVGLALCLAAVYGGHTAWRLTPTAEAHLRPGAPVVLRGVVRKDGLPERGRRIIVEAAWRRTAAGWEAQGGRFGLAAPEELRRPARPGDVVEVSGLLQLPPPATYPGGASPRLQWLRRGVQYLVRVRPRGYRLLGHQPAPAWTRFFQGLRGHILAANRVTLSPTAAHIANDFLIGDDQPPDPELAQRIDDAFRDSGTIHLLVVSGTQVTLVLGLFALAGQRLHRARHLLWFLGGLALGVYYLLTDGAAPVSRAAVMGIAFLVGRALDREPDLENCLGFSALALLMANPLGLFDIGFQLSFMAVWALIRLSPPLNASFLALLPGGGEGPVGKVWMVCRTALAGGAAGCIAAHLGVAPVLEYHFQRASWFAILANIPMAGLAVAMMYASLAHMLLAPLGLTLLAPLVELAARALYAVALLFSGPPVGAAGVFPPPLWLMPLLALGVAVPSWLKRGMLAPLAAAAALAGALFLSEQVPALPPAAPTLRALDVGQGDALLLQSWFVTACRASFARYCASTLTGVLTCFQGGERLRTSLVASQSGRSTRVALI